MFRGIKNILAATKEKRQKNNTIIGSVIVFWLAGMTFLFVLASFGYKVFNSSMFIFLYKSYYIQAAVFIVAIFYGIFIYKLNRFKDKIGDFYAGDKESFITQLLILKHKYPKNIQFQVFLYVSYNFFKDLIIFTILSYATGGLLTYKYALVIAFLMFFIAIRNMIKSVEHLNFEAFERFNLLNRVEGA